MARCKLCVLKLLAFSTVPFIISIYYSIIFTSHFSNFSFLRREWSLRKFQTQLSDDRKIFIVTEMGRKCINFLHAPLGLVVGKYVSLHGYTTHMHIHKSYFHADFPRRRIDCACVCLLRTFLPHSF